MAASVEYKGHILTPASRYRQDPEGWTLEVKIKPVGRMVGGRRCRAPNLFETEKQATRRAISFGRRIVDGKIHPRPKK